MSIKHRMYVLIFAAFMGMAGLAGLSVIQINRVFTAANFASVNVVPSLIALDEANIATARLRIVLWKYVVTKDPVKKNQYASEMKQLHDEAIASIDKYEKEYIADDKDRAMLKTDREAIEIYEPLRAQAMALSDDGKVDEASDLLITSQLGSHMTTAIKAHNDYNIELSNQGEAEAKTILGRADWQAALIALLVIGVVASMGIWMTRLLSRSLGEAIGIAQTVAAGDLTQDVVVSSDDEFGQLQAALKKMHDSLADIVGQVRTSTDTIATASAEIASGNMDLSARTESQASSLEETAASMEELTSTVRQNSDNAQQANQLAQAASEVAVKGGAVVSDVVDTMGAINDASRKIVDIIAVIDSIAFQTNILALNAAVEAARAGEQGRGFAVVAAEVRNLAQRSAAAAHEIKELINTSVEKVDTGSKLVDQAGMTMSEVVDSIRRVADIMSEITAAGAEQSQGIGQINEAITQMDDATQQNAALVEEAAAAAKSLQDQAANLSDVVGIFKMKRQPQRGKPALAAVPASTRSVPLAPASSAPARVRSHQSATMQVLPREKAEAWEEF
ncbi:MAG: MCP four helix bundle domain-containing protein [Burkholderiaceae bacterium]|nr:MCP four helix bundle domain-containing protein [Burkholderiaceae bacterium]